MVQCQDGLGSLWAEREFLLHTHSPRDGSISSPLQWTKNFDVVRHSLYRDCGARNKAGSHGSAGFKLPLQCRL